MKYSILVILMMFCHNAFAESYKWVDDNGRVHYSDQPPATGANSKIIGSTSKTRGSAETGDATEPGNAAETSGSGEPKTTAEREAELKKKQKADKRGSRQGRQGSGQQECQPGKLRPGAT